MICVFKPKLLAIINSEIKTVYIAETYEDKLALEMLAEADINLNLVNRETGVLKKII